MKNKLLQILIFIIFLSLIINPNIVSIEIKSALNVFINILFPSIFPFILISDLLIKYNFLYTLNKIFGKLFKNLFHTNEASSFIVIMSLLSGFPSGAKNIKSLLDNNMIDIDDANYLITFTHFANPLFVISLANNIINNTKTIYILLFSIYISNFIIAYITRPKNIKLNKKMKQIATPSFSNALSSSIKSTFNLLMLILGTTCFFYILTGYINKYLNLPIIYQTIIYGIFDLTKGVTLLQQLKINTVIIEFLFIFFISFSGINIHMQVLSILDKTNVSYTNFLLGRICQTTISIIIFLILT